MWHLTTFVWFKCSRTIKLMLDIEALTQRYIEILKRNKNRGRQPRHISHLRQNNLCSLQYLLIFLSFLSELVIRLTNELCGVAKPSGVCLQIGIILIYMYIFLTHERSWFCYTNNTRPNGAGPCWVSSGLVLHIIISRLNHL